jgi:hypothetical protein
LKPAQVNKLYSKLIPYEQAVLCFEAAARQDEAEINDIVDSIEKHTYRCLHTDYRQRATGLYMLALFYGTQYWKTRTLMMMAFNIYRDDRACSIAKQFIVRLASIDAALLDVCRRIKVDVEAVKTLADCKGETGFSDYVEAELVEQYTELFTKAVMLE